MPTHHSYYIGESTSFNTRKEANVMMDPAKRQQSDPKLAKF
jgi:hypothetical protein